MIVADGAMLQQRKDLKEELIKEYPNYKGCIEAQIGAALSCYLGPGLLGAGIQFIDD